MYTSRKSPVRSQDLVGSPSSKIIPGGEFRGRLAHYESGFQRFDSNRFLILRGGIPRSPGSFPEVWTQGFLVCGFFVCRLTVSPLSGARQPRAPPTGMATYLPAYLPTCLPAYLHGTRFFGAAGPTRRGRDGAPHGHPSVRETLHVYMYIYIYIYI